MVSSITDDEGQVDQFKVRAEVNQIVDLVLLNSTAVTKERLYGLVDEARQLSYGKGFRDGMKWRDDESDGNRVPGMA